MEKSLENSAQKQVDQMETSGFTLNEMEVTASAKRRFKKRFSNVGLDIGSHHVKMVQFRNKGGHIHMNQYSLHPLPEGAVEEGRIEDAALLSDRLKWIFKRRRYHTNRINMCVSTQSVILRQVFMPVMAPRDFPNAIRWEAEKHIMMPLEDVILDYFYIGERVIEGNRVMEVVLVAVPKETLNGYLEVATRAGLYPDVIEIEPLALQRLVNLTLGGGEEAPQREEDASDTVNYLMIDLGGEFTNLLLLENGRYSFTRSINLGTNHFVRQVAEQRQISLEKAERMVFQADPFQLQGVTEVAGEFLDEINRSLEFYVSKMYHEDKEISYLLLCGGGIYLDGLASYLGERINASPLLLNSRKIFPWARRYVPPGLDEHGPLLGVASGLALRGWLR